MYDSGIEDDFSGVFSAGSVGSDEEEDVPTESAPDRGAVDERQVSVVEQCIFWGGEQRLRVQVTLSTAGMPRTRTGSRVYTRQGYSRDILHHLGQATLKPSCRGLLDCTPLTWTFAG